MPKEMAAIGDPDAVCVVASIDAHHRVDVGSKEKSDPKRDDFLEVTMRQLALHTGKLTAHANPAESKASMLKADAGYFNKTKLKDTTTAVMYCYQAFASESGRFLFGPDQRAQNLAKDLADRNLPPIKPDALNPDALCYVLISHGIPATKRAAQANPDAQRGLVNLMRAQLFYIGRLIGAGDHSALERNLTEAYRFSIQLDGMSDAKSVAQPLGTACVKRYQDTTVAVLDYAK